MNNVKFSISIFLLTFQIILLSSCHDEEIVIESNYVNYVDEQKLSFSDGDGAPYDATVRLIESGYVILDFDSKLPDLHIQSDGSYVKHWMDLGTVTAPTIWGFREDINGNGPNGFGDFGQYTRNVTLNDKRYVNVASAFVWADTIRYDVHSQRGIGVIGISDRDNQDGFQINKQ